MSSSSGVADGVRDVFVSEVVLDEPGIAAFICQIVAGRVPQHIDFHGEYDFSAEKMQDSVGLNLPKILSWKAD